MYTIDVTINGKPGQLFIATSRYRPPVPYRNRGLSFFLGTTLLSSLIVSPYEIECLKNAVSLPHPERPAWYVHGLAHRCRASDGELVLSHKTYVGDCQEHEGWAEYRLRELTIRTADPYESFLDIIDTALTYAPERGGLPIYTLPAER